MACFPSINLQTKYIYLNHVLINIKTKKHSSELKPLLQVLKPLIEQSEFASHKKINLRTNKSTTLLFYSLPIQIKNGALVTKYQD